MRYSIIADSVTGLTEEDVVSNALLFFLAGFSTTSDTLLFFFYEIALNPDVQDKVGNLPFINLEDSL